MKRRQPAPWNARLRQLLRHCRDAKIRGRAELLLRAQELGGVARACRERGKTERYYYFWWNRFQSGGYRLEALQEKSRRPKRPDRQTKPQVIRWIRHYREKFQFNLREIQHALVRERQVRVSVTTIHRVLLREKVPPRRKPAPLRSARSTQRLKMQTTSVSTEPTVETPVAKLDVPSRIAGRYRVARCLGSGAGGTVYLVQDDQAPEAAPLALKWVQSKLESDEAAYSLRNEFQTLFSLHHPHLARVFDLGAEGDHWYFTSEYVAGTDLLTATRDANLNTVFQLVVQTLRALDFLHRKGVLHLDLKPGNILVTDPDRSGDLTVKLIDFGNAAWRRQGGFTGGEFVGTLPYAAPEMVLEQPPSPASDLYSLGMLLHQIFARRFPFRDQDPLAMMQEQVYGQPLRMEQLHPALPEDFADLLLKLVARNPEDRFQTPREVLEALNQSLGETFTLRENEAPVSILDESSQLFRGELLEELVVTLISGRPQVIFLSGPEGSGKSRLLRELKGALQLRHGHPLWWDHAADLQAALRRGELPAAQPLLLDDSAADAAVLRTLLSELEDLRAPVLVATRLPISLELNPSRWISLASLSLVQLSTFLSAEIRDFPEGGFAAALREWSGGMPRLLEQALQAMREEGAIQWTDRGWAWTGTKQDSFGRLWAAHRQRWEERRQRAEEILSIAGLGLSARTLEGMLSLEPGALRDKLPEWERQGGMVCKTTRHETLYFSKKSAKRSIALSSSEDWSRVQMELKRLYEAGAFAGGVALAERLTAAFPQAGGIPDLVRLWCARHQAAAGHAEEAARELPAKPPPAAQDRALFFEVRARVGFLRGNLPEALAELEQAERQYRKGGEGAGLSRVYNLRGSVLKKMGQLSDAESAFTSAIQAGRDSSDSLHQGFATMNLANLLFDQGLWDRADARYREALEWDQAAANPSFSCKLRENRLNLLFQMGRSAEVEPAAYELLRLAIRYRYPEQQAAALNYLALLAGQKNHRELQLEQLRQALGILHPRQSPQAYFQTLMNRADVYLDLHRYTPAQLDAEEALAMAERSANNTFLSWVFLLLGKIHRDRPRPDVEAASRYFNQAYRRIWEHQIRPLLWEVEYERGLLAKRNGEGERAQNYFLVAKRYLDAFLLEMPEPAKRSFLRDRKREKILAELAVSTKI